MSSAHRVMSSGIPPLDARLGGIVAGRLHLLSGGPGTGKSTACLQFIGHGLRLGDAAAMLTSERTQDVRSHAAHLCIDLDGPLRDGRLVLLRYRSGFSTLLQHSASPEQMLDDLRRMILPIHPARLVIDTVSPFLATASHSDATVDALAELLEEMDAATLLTYSGDVTGGRGAGGDDHIQSLVDRTAAVFHLARQVDGHGASVDVHDSPEPIHRFHVVRVRQPLPSTAPASYRMEAGVGIVLVPPARDDGAATQTSRRLLELPIPIQPTEPAADAPSGMRYRPLDRHGFAHALAAHVAHDHPAQYTVVSLIPSGPRIAAQVDAGGSSEHPVPETPLLVLAALVMRSMRVAGGDLAAILDGRVAVYLHGARLGDASPFIERVRELWALQHHATLRVESHAYPADEPLWRALVEDDEAATDGRAGVVTDGVMSESGCPM